MKRAVILHGALGEEFGARFELDVDTPADALRALIAQIRGFRKRLTEGAYHVLWGSHELELEALSMKLGSLDRELHIVPQVVGAASGLGKLLAGLALVGIALAAPYLLPETFGSSATLFAAGALKVTLGIGIALAAGGVGMMLAKAPETPAGDDSSFLFGAQSNQAAQGVPVPLVYGRTVCGSVVVSNGLEQQQLLTQGGESIFFRSA
jgi:predicted phage tail protein